MGYSQWYRKQSDMTEHLTVSEHSSREEGLGKGVEVRGSSSPGGCQQRDQSDQSWLHVRRTHCKMKTCGLLLEKQEKCVTKGIKTGTSLVVQWFRLCTPNAGAVGLIPGWRTKMPHAAWWGEKGILKKCFSFFSVVSFS